LGEKRGEGKGGRRRVKGGEKKGKRRVEGGGGGKKSAPGVQISNLGKSTQQKFILSYDEMQSQLKSARCSNSKIKGASDRKIVGRGRKKQKMTS